MKLPSTTFRFIFYFVRQQWVKFAIFIVVSVSWAVNDTIFPYFLKRMVNTLQFYHGSALAVFAAVKGILLLVILFWVLMEVLQRSQGILQIYTFPRFRASIRAAVFEYVKAHSHDYFSSHFAGNLGKKLGDLPTSAQAVMEIICFQFVTAGVGSIVVLTMMYITQPFFALILLVWLCIHLGLTAIFLRYGNLLWVRHSDSVSTLSGKIIDVFSNILNVRLFANEQYESRYLKNYQRDEIKKSKKAMWLMEITRIGLGLNGLFLVFGMLCLLIYSWSRHWITLGDFTQVGMQSFWLLGWIWFVSYQMTVFARELGVVSDALNLVRKKHDLVDAENALPIQITRGEIVFDQVNFSYHKGHEIFKHLNAVIPAGQKVGLVGFSGSGKTTLVNLILRFFDVQKGKILIDGQDIALVTQESLRSQIAMIPQDPGLFHRSLMDNIRYGRITATDDEVIQASKLAHCHEFIETLDAGYASLVGERGVKLSGGQRQRIAIARAILKNAPILILDEATSSLDSVTEKLIQDSLRHLMEDRTTLVIAHRLSTLADMDRILVFDQGKLVEEGTQQQLLQMKGHFSRLWAMQADGFLPDSRVDSFVLG